MSWLQAITAFFQLIDTILRKHLQKKRELKEQEIKENPRAFFNKGNVSSTDKPESNSLSADSKE